MPPMVRKRVDFPAPFLPRMPTNSPFGTSRVTSESALKADIPSIRPKAMRHRVPSSPIANDFETPRQLTAIARIGGQHSPADERFKPLFDKKRSARSAAHEQQMSVDFFI